MSNSKKETIENQQHVQSGKMKVPQVIVDAICGMVHDIAYDLAADGSDFNKVASVKELVAACVSVDAALYDTFVAARDSAVEHVATNCGDGDAFEPCTELNLPQP